MSTAHEAPPAAEEHSKAVERSKDADSDAQSTGEHARNIEAGVPQATAEAHQASAPSRQRKFVLFALLAAVCLVLLVASGWILSKKNKAVVEEQETPINPKLPFGSVTFVKDSEHISKSPTGYASDPLAKKALLQRALNLKSEFLNALGDKIDAASYFVKPIQITPNVFPAADENEHYVDQVDYTLAVPNKQYSNEQLTTVKQVQNLFKSEFEWKHFYTFYTILEYQDLATLDFYSLFGLSKEVDGYEPTKIVNYIVAQHFNCFDSQGQYLSGVPLLNNVFKSDFYNVLVTVYAKGAVVLGDRLALYSDSLSSRFPMWFQSGSFVDNGQCILSFVQEFMLQLQHALHYCNSEFLLQHSKTISLQSVLHRSLLWTFALGQRTHPYFTRMDSLLIQHDLKLDDYYVNFAKFTEAHSGGIPVFPKSNKALLPDVFQPEDQAADV